MKGRGERCPEALFARGRRGPLSLVEQRALDAHLAVCGLCQATMLLADLSDQIPDESGPDAETRVARVATRVAYGGRVRRHPLSRALALAFGVVVLAMTGVAAAWVLGRRARPATRDPGTMGSPSPGAVTLAAPGNDRLLAAPVSQAPPPVVPAARPVAGPAPARTVGPAPLAGPARRRAAPASRAAAAAPPSPEPQPARELAGSDGPAALTTGFGEGDRGGRRELAPGEGPAELFKAANAARGAHALREAVARYEALQRRFPGSAEARLSFFSTGDVLLRLGEPGAALAAFDRYLQALPSGSLAAEALFGRARCLDAMGRRGEAVQAWERLQRDYPRSIYEAPARRRLTENEP